MKKYNIFLNVFVLAFFVMLDTYAIRFRNTGQTNVDLIIRHTQCALETASFNDIAKCKALSSVNGTPSCLSMNYMHNYYDFAPFDGYRIGIDANSYDGLRQYYSYGLTSQIRIPLVSLILPVGRYAAFNNYPKINIDDDIEVSDCILYRWIDDKNGYGIAHALQMKVNGKLVKVEKPVVWGGGN
ncbi:MAG TPA: hypothetical protein VJ201_01040 [Candidatus Babeliales bacterium]|nr:hypothetical protein [Candidatus Babeliales bacterium]